MKISNIIKALEKVGLKVEKRVHRKHGHDHFTYIYYCDSKNYTAIWYEQTRDNGEIDSVYIRRLIGENYDIMGDYYPGSFVDTIKIIVNQMTDQCERI